MDEEEPTEADKLLTLMGVLECLENNQFAIVPWASDDEGFPTVFSVVGPNGAVTLRKTENVAPCTVCDREGGE